MKPSEKPRETFQKIGILWKIVPTLWKTNKIFRNHLKSLGTL